MAQKDINANVILNGKVGNGFTRMASALNEFGTSLEKAGEWAQELLGDSLKTYQSYEDNMLAARFALSSQYDDAAELNRVMAQLNDSASEWASTTIFHTDDVSEAILNAARSGWDLNKIMEGVPNAMLIAQAGGLELSTGLDYLVKMMNSTGTAFEDSRSFVDQWAKAANLSATNIGEMGEAFLALGTTGTLAESTEELFALMAALANVGTTGSKAGTALRSAMLRVVAPTTNAQNAMSLLGADADELSDILSDESIAKAAEKLKGLGFSAYDSEGNLKGMIQIFKELYQITADLDEQTRNELLAAIFPTRTFSQAQAFLKAISDGSLESLYESILSADGYAQSGAEIMMSGLTGSIETLKSKWEELERKIGEFSAPTIETLADKAGSILDGINGLDPQILALMTGVLEGIAGISAVGGAVKAITALIGLFNTPLLVTTGVAAAAMGMIELVKYLNQQEEIKFIDQFGTLGLDAQQLNDYVSALPSAFNDATAAAQSFTDAAQAGIDRYEDLLTNFSKDLLTETLIGGKFTKEEYDAFLKQVDGMDGAVAEAAANMNASLLTFYSETGGQNGMAALWLNSYFSGLEEEAYEIGSNIRTKLFEALGNGELTEEDRRYIQAQTDRYSKIIAEISERQRESEYQTQLYKASRVSWDSAADFLRQNADSMNLSLAKVEEEFANEYGSMRAAFLAAQEKGESFVWTDANGVQYQVDATDAAWQRYVDDYNRRFDQYYKSEQKRFTDIGDRVLDTLFADSEMAEGYGILKELVQSGAYSYDGDLDLSKYSRQDLEGWMDALETLSDKVKYGTIEEALGGIENSPYIETMAMGLKDAPGLYSSVANYLDYLRQQDVWAREELDAANVAVESAEQRIERIQGEIDRTQEARARQFEQLVSMDKDADPNGYEELFDYLYGGGYDAKMAGLNEKLAQAQSELAAAQEQAAALQAQLDTLQGTAEVEMPDGEAMGKAFSDDVQKGMYPVKQEVKTEQGEGGEGDETGPGFAEGGRAVTASIFGEAGPEWAIPEAHTERTAQLLNAARQASGFTWGELINRNGGLNGLSGVTVTIGSYSPVIHAENAQGVEAALNKDKERLTRLVKQAVEKALAEKEFMEGIEIYA